ncbi:MAG: glutamate--tRNA ligase family protein [Oscillospiraceae bacterium]
MNENERMAELLLPDITKTPDYYEELYKPRNLPEGARVTRIAPSPTGYLHLGTLFTALVNRITATSSGGIFYTRIEDTDKKREVEGGIDDIIGGLDRFGIKIDEGLISGDKQTAIMRPISRASAPRFTRPTLKSL